MSVSKKDIQALNIDIRKLIIYIVSSLFILLFFYYSSKINSIYTHSFIETINIFMGLSMVIIAINTYHFTETKEFVFLGFSYIPISIFLILHVIVSLNNPTSHIISIHLILISVYLEGIAFLIQSIIIDKKIKSSIFIILYLFFTSLLFVYMYWWNLLPMGILNGEGQLLHTAISHFLLFGTLVASLFIFHKKKSKFQDDIYYGFIFSLLTKIFSTAFFIVFVTRYDTSSLIGHLLRLISYYLLYKAIVETTLKRPYKEIDMKNDTLKAILESTADGILVYTDDDKVIRYNEKYAEIFNIPQEVLDKKNGIDYREWAKNQFVEPSEFVRKIDEISKNFNKEHYDIIEFKNGKIFERFYKPLILGEQISGKVWSFRDITLQTKSTSDLIIKERIIESSPNAVIYTDLDCNILYANKTFLNLWGYESLKEVIGRNKLEYFSEPIIKEIISTFETPNDWHGEVIATRKDGSTFPAEIFANSIINDKGEEIFRTAYIIDITARKEAEKLKEQVIQKQEEVDEIKEYDNIKTQFFSNISHDLKTPLNVLLGVIQLLDKIHVYEDCQHNEELSKYLKMMKQNCYRLLRLIGNLIDITRFDSGFLKINLRNYNIVDLVENITLSVVEYAKTKGITLVFDTNIEEKIIAIDPDMIERIILNLLSNSIKFTGIGGTIDVNIEDYNDGVAISIKDTGIGIPEDKFETIFERFKQVGNSLSKEYEGSGIGLSLVKAMVEAHNGKITVESEYGKGTKFSIFLPGEQLPENTQYDETASTREINIDRINIEFSDIYTGIKK